MIAVLGLLLTTIGGSDNANTIQRGNTTESVQVSGLWWSLPCGQGGRSLYSLSLSWKLLSLWRCEADRGASGAVVEGDVLDVQLHTQAHLQAPGGTPAPTSAEPTNNSGAEAAWAVDGVLNRLQAPLEPEYGGVGRTAELICAYPWPQGCDYWIGIAWCESTLGQDPWAYDDRNPYIGLLQVDEAHGYGREWLKDDANNVLAAWELSREGTRTSPWPYCQ